MKKMFFYRIFILSLLFMSLSTPAIAKMMNIGAVYGDKGDLDRALRYFLDDQAIKDRLGLHNTADYANLMMSIGIVYAFKGDLDRALRYFLDSKEIMDNLGLQNTADYPLLLYNMGILYEKQGKREMAGRYYRNAYESYVRSGYIGPDRDDTLKRAQRLGY